MTKLTLALALTTVVFAGSTAWLVRELGAERARVAALTTAHAAIAARNAVAAPAAVATEVAATTRTAGPPANPPTAAPVSSDPSATSKAVRAALARDYLEQFTDPVRRAGIVARTRAELRRAYTHLAKTVGLTPDEETRLIDLLAEQRVRSREAIAQCSLEATCQPGNALPGEAERAMQEQTALLGSERYERFIEFGKSVAERRQVSELGRRLPDGESLSDAQTEELIASLAAEGRRFAEEAQQRGDAVAALSVKPGTIVMAAPRAGPDLGARQMESAAEFSRRMREQAAKVLTPRQMETYNQMQDELLSSARESVRYDEVVDNARRATAH